MVNRIQGTDEFRLLRHKLRLLHEGQKNEPREDNHAKLTIITDRKTLKRRIPRQIMKNEKLQF